MAPPNDYKPIPSSEAKTIAEKYDKQVVVILAIDRVHEMTHTTTYGVGPEDKLAAASLGDQLPFILGLTEGPRKFFEDFRTTQQAEWKVEKDRLEARIRELESK